MLRAFNPFAAIQILYLDCRKISEGELVEVFIILVYYYRWFARFTYFTSRLFYTIPLEYLENSVWPTYKMKPLIE